MHYVCAMRNKPTRRSDGHARSNRTLLLRNDLYGQVEVIAYNQSHSMSSFVEELLEKEAAKAHPKKKR